MLTCVVSVNLLQPEFLKTSLYAGLYSVDAIPSYFTVTPFVSF